MLDAANDREQRLLALLEEFRIRWPLVVTELEKPRPMCRPDPLEDLMPPARGEGTMP